MKANTPVIAADIGGTHARIGVVMASEPANGSARPELVSYEKFKCADFDGLASIFDRFVNDNPIAALGGGVIACAGYFEKSLLHASNVPWSVSLDDLRAVLGNVELVGINDYEAVAYGTQFLSHGEALSLNPGAIAVETEARAVMGPGTGLGAAVLQPCKSGAVTLTTEAGHAGLAPRTDKEREIHRILSGKYDFVCVEHVLSGPGLVNIYTSLAEINDVEAQLTRPSHISKAAVENTDPLAVEALSTFCDLLGSFAGDLALTYGARGGVYLAGGILPKFREFLKSSGFLEAFLSKGKVRRYLESVPVHLIDHGQLGVVGAAGWYLDQWQD